MSKLEETTASLERVQRFDTTKLPRREDLGTAFSFEEAVPHVERTIALFKRIPISVLSDLPDKELGILQTQADAFYARLEQVLNFNAQEANAPQARESLISALQQSYQGTFSHLRPYISYAVASATDFSGIEAEALATLQGIKDETANALEEISNAKTEATDVIQEIKRVAAEQGVSQQAFYFKEEADTHEKNAGLWVKFTLGWAAALILYGAASFFLHKWDWLTPQTTADAIALVASKILIFGVLSYMLLLSARNFLSYRHNAIVNRHRQNALMTFNALVKAGTTDSTQDIILSYASACIFSPQDTGYTKQSSFGSSSAGPPVEILQRIAPRTTE